MNRSPRVLCGLCLLAATVFWLAGCAGSAPASRYYVLAPPMAEKAPASTRAVDGLRLGVETFAVDPPYDQPRLVYRVGRDAGEIGFYQHHRWASSPGRLVTTGLVAGLRDLDGLASVEPSSLTGTYDWVLTGRVVALEELDLPGRHIARIRVDLELHDVEVDAILWADMVETEIEGQAADASDIMAQMRRAFAALVVDVRTGVEEALNEHGKPGGQGAR